ncbi:MAG: hypothetical protein KIT14_23770 [bacterium]|nr:hypothetical protein [bacterium]
MLPWCLLSVLLSASAADAVQLCVRVDGPTGAVRNGASIRLRAACRAREKALPLSFANGETTVLVQGANLQIVDGSGSTYGASNGRGNLIVGYDEGRCIEDGAVVGTCTTAGAPCAASGVCNVADKTGSHNVVVGPANRYPSTGGIVGGQVNTVSGEGGAALGGLENVVSGALAATTGGYRNRARGVAAAVTAGSDAVVLGDQAVVVGGRGNSAPGGAAVVTGGDGNVARGEAAVVGGGLENVARGAYSVVCGGVGEETNELFEVVCRPTP